MLTTNSSVNSELSINVDVLIIGGGIAGLSTAYYLSQYPQLKTVVLEAKRIGGSHCSSTGEERMYRLMYSSEYLSDLQEKALQEWHSIEAKHNCQLLRENGLLFYQPSAGRQRAEGSPKGFPSVKAGGCFFLEDISALSAEPALGFKTPPSPRCLQFVGVESPSNCSSCPLPPASCLSRISLARRDH